MKVAHSDNYTRNTGGWTSQDEYPRQLADVDGDGRADIVGFVSNSVVVSRSVVNDDTLAGGLGDDVYRFGRGDGRDRIVENDSDIGNDRLVFEAGIDAHQLWFTKTGSDLEVQVVGTSDKVTIAGWYGGAEHHMDSIETADGTVLLDTMVDGLVQAMAGFAPPTAGTMSIDPDLYPSVEHAITAAWR